VGAPLAAFRLRRNGDRIVGVRHAVAVIVWLAIAVIVTMVVVDVAVRVAVRNTVGVGVRM